MTLAAVFVVIPRWHASSPDWLAKTAIEQLDGTKVLRYQGTFVDNVGRSVRMDAQVGGDNQSVGWQEIDGQRAEFVASRSGTYLKADAEYWNIADPAYSPLYAGRWAKSVSANCACCSAPGCCRRALVRNLRKKFVGGDAKLAKSSAARVGGVRAVRVTAPGKGGIYVSKSSPHRLLRVEGMAIGTVNHGLNNFALDVQPLDAAAVRVFDARFASLPKTMAGVVDLDQDATLPAQYVVDDKPAGEPPPCGASSCRIYAMVRNLYGAARPGEQHRLIGVVRKGEPDSGGPVLGRCELVLPPMARDKPTKVSCVVRDARWTRWSLNPVGDWYSWSFIAFNPGWEGPDFALASKLFEDLVDEEAVYDASAEGGALGVQIFAKLIRVPGLKPAAVVEIIRQAIALDRLDVVGRYVNSGRVGNPAGLKALADATAAVPRIGERPTAPKH